ncbi:MAG: hypothetical protein V1866_04930 [archaeon]
MNEKLIFTLILAMLISAMPTLGATIHGRIFDYSFEIAKNSIVKINSMPTQVMVSTDGNYSFSVPEGDFQIVALQKDSADMLMYYVEENISILSDGDYVRDLIMFPAKELDELDLDPDLMQMINGAGETDKDDTSTGTKYTPLYIVLGAIVIVLAFALKKILLRKKKSGHNPYAEESDDLADMLAFIKKHRRVTQKDIRKEFSLSEAKISLLLTDLESQHKIRKIKKGRGNIIIYDDKN